ncbi:hypothetical protein V5799_016050 [Amblyomma americanum]|uniref:Uncharacterized protein n=1 Tax=Amblyomma americanum TaxID=6943 RepID=A0AAQ4F7J3_AMBAM
MRREHGPLSSEEKKRALLLTLCGPETFETVLALVAPKSRGQVPYDEIVQTLASHYHPRLSELYCRCKFQSGDQQPGEPIASYVAALRKLAAHCNFGVGASSAAEAAAESTTAAVSTALPLDILLRDRFVCGIRNELFQQRLFAERKLTFQKAFDFAERAESAALQQQSIKMKTENLEVRKTSRGKEGAKREQPTPRKARCYRCDGSHDPTFHLQGVRSDNCKGAGTDEGSCETAIVASAWDDCTAFLYAYDEKEGKCTPDLHYINASGTYEHLFDCVSTCNPGQGAPFCADPPFGACNETNIAQKEGMAYFYNITTQECQQYPLCEMELLNLEVNSHLALEYCERMCGGFNETNVYGTNTAEEGGS